MNKLSNNKIIWGASIPDYAIENGIRRKIKPFLLQKKVHQYLRVLIHFFLTYQKDTSPVGCFAKKHPFRMFFQTLRMSRFFVPIAKSGIISIVVICFSFLGFEQFYRSISGRISLLNTESRHYSKTATILDRIALGVFSENAGRKIPLMPKSPTKEKKEILRFLCYLVNTFSVSMKYSLILIAALFIMGNILNRNKFIVRRIRDFFIPPGIKYYSRWRFKFISPIEKCIFNRADIYDINPIGIGIYGAGLYRPGKTRTLFNCKQSAGFSFNGEWSYPYPRAGFALGHKLVNSIWFLKIDRLLMKLNSNDQILTTRL